MKTSKHKKCKTKKKLIQYNNTKYKKNNSTYKIKRVHTGGLRVSELTKKFELLTQGSNVIPSYNKQAAQ